MCLHSPASFQQGLQADPFGVCHFHSGPGIRFLFFNTVLLESLRSKAHWIYLIQSLF